MINLKNTNINKDDTFIIFSGMLTSDLPIRCNSYPEYITLNIEEIPPTMLVDYNKAILKFWMR